MSARVTCSRCGAELPIDEPEKSPCAACGDTRRAHQVVLDVARVNVTAHDPGGRIRSAERMPSKRPAYEKTFGPDLHRDSGTQRRVTRTFDRKKDIYKETVRTMEGDVVRTVEEPLTDHRGHGAARRSDS